VRVAVVGGGIAGTVAALACRDAGADVTLLEVRPRLGGAAYSYRREDLDVDNGQHVVLRCCTAYWAHLDRIGARGLVRMQERLAIPVLAPGRPVAWLRRDALPAPLHLVRSLAGYGHLAPRDRLAAMRAARALGRLDPSDPKLDERTFASWLKERGQSDAAVRRLWELIALPALNLRAAEASLALAAKVFRTGLLEDADAGDIGWADVPLSRIHHDAALRALSEAGVDVRLGARVDAVGPADAGGVSVTVADGALAADAAIVAVPPARAATLLPQAARAAADGIAAAGDSPIVNVHVRFDRRVLPWPFAAAVDSPVQFVFDRTAQAGERSGQYVAVSQSAATDEMRARPEALGARIVAGLTELLPAAGAAQVRDVWVTREHAATFRGVPGTATLRPEPATAAPGVFVAGAWTRTGWPATLEGAARSGAAAARAALSAAHATRPVGVAA
jgi:hydroxysqualene dehydroxylase